MKSLKYLVFGIPTNVEEAMDKLAEDEPEKVKIVLEQIPPRTIKVKLNARYEVTTKFNGRISFNQTISKSYRIDSFYSGKSEEVQKAIKYLRNQIDILENKGIEVSVLTQGRYLSDKEFNIILKE